MLLVHKRVRNLYCSKYTWNATYYHSDFLLLKLGTSVSCSVQNLRFLHHNIDIPTLFAKVSTFIKNTQYVEKFKIKISHIYALSQYCTLKCPNHLETILFSFYWKYIAWLL